MKIYINGEKFDVFDYDDDATILERYSLKFSDSAPALPSFFRITDQDFALEKNLKLNVEDVRDYIGELDQYNLTDENIIQDILSKYPRLRKREIGFLWILSHPKEKVNPENFKLLDRSAFLSDIKAGKSVEDFRKEVARINTKNKLISEDETKIYKELSDLDSVPTEPFIVEESSIAMGLTLPNRETILDIFDAMTVSKDVPFIALVYKRKKYFKVYTHTIPPDGWIEAAREHEGIYFKILNQPTSKLSSKKILIENLYADSFWSIENVVYFTFKIREGGQDLIRNKIFSILDNRVTFDVVSSRQIGIKGTFTVKDFSLERYVFADLVATDNLFKRFLFFDERGGSDGKIKTALTKARLFVHYMPSTKEGGISLAVTITPGLEATKESLTFRVSGASNFQQANAVANTFSKLLSLYKQRMPEIKALYESLIPNLQKGKQEKKKEVVIDKKTKKRLAALRSVDPDMFRERYGDQCQREGQPLIINEEEATKAVQKFKKDGVPNPSHKVMFFNGRYFLCDPREPDDKKAKPHIWPGLKVNKPSNKLKGVALDNAIEFAKKHPLLPCCYTTDQYIKKASHLRMYMEERKGGKEEEETKRKPAGAEHILGPNRVALPERFGEMPFNWGKIFKNLKLKKASKGKQEFYPILRYGVSETPDSFIHCLERVFNSSYSTMSIKKRGERVMDVRRKIAEWPSFNIGRQEAFDYTDDTIRDILEDSNMYIDPDLFISILQTHYKCNIFLYAVDTDNPNGSVVIPKYSQAYLPRDIDTDKPSILIVKYEVGKDFPYQCELVSAVKLRHGKIEDIDFKFESPSPILDMAIKMFYESNEVFIINPEGYEPYKFTE